FRIIFGVVAKDAVRDAVESPLVPYIAVVDAFCSSDFEARKKVVGHALLELLFVRMVLLELGHVLLESP
ncbi:1403_t:CDS:2, partial [Gigaspora rosea]